jgi:hypothetical protein
MPRITCPKHADCYVDCPGSGYAYYVEPYGPCTSGCDQAKAGDALATLIRDANENARFFGSAVGLTTGVLAKFAREIAEHVPVSVLAYVHQLQNLDILNDTRRINALWEDAEVGGVILALAQSASGGLAPPAARAA